MVILKKTIDHSFKTDPLTLKMVNLLMREGKKEKAEKFLYKIFCFIEENYPGEALNIFYLAVFHTQLLVGVRLKAKGKKKRRNINTKNIFTPYFLSNTRSQTIAIRSLFVSGKNRSLSHPLWQNLSEELLEAALNKGIIIEKRYETHKIAKNNKRLYPSLWIRKYNEHKFNSFN